MGSAHFSTTLQSLRQLAAVPHSPLRNTVAISEGSLSPPPPSLLLLIFILTPLSPCCRWYPQGRAPVDGLGTSPYWPLSVGVPWDVWCVAPQSPSKQSWCTYLHAVAISPSLVWWSTTPPSAASFGEPACGISYPCALWNPLCGWWLNIVSTCAGSPPLRSCGALPPMRPVTSLSSVVLLGMQWHVGIVA